MTGSGMHLGRLVMAPRVGLPAGNALAVPRGRAGARMSCDDVRSPPRHAKP